MHMTASNRQPITENAAAVRHAVYRDVLDYLPIASYDQARQFVANLALVRDEGRGTRDNSASRERQINAALVRFMNMRVTPDIAEAAYRGAKLKEIEYWLNRKYGERLAVVPGFYRRDAETQSRPPFRLNLPFNCAMYGYRSDAGFYNGILCQPVDRHDFYFLLSSSKYGGTKALRLTPRDQQYFTQFEEVRI